MDKHPSSASIRELLWSLWYWFFLKSLQEQLPDTLTFTSLLTEVSCILLSILFNFFRWLELFYFLFIARYI